MANKSDGRKRPRGRVFRQARRELLVKLKAKQEAESKTSLQALHACPKCGAPLKARSFQKIEIDQCTGCNGIWLDAGELEQVAGKDESSWLGKFWQKNG